MWAPTSGHHPFGVVIALYLLLVLHPGCVKQLAVVGILTLSLYTQSGPCTSCFMLYVVGCLGQWLAVLASLF